MQTRQGGIEIVRTMARTVVATLATALACDAAGAVESPLVLEPRSRWSPVALVYSHTDRQTGVRQDRPVGAPGTGFMLSPCYLITNYHVAFGDAPGRSAAPGAKLTVWLGEPARAYEAIIEAAGDFAPAAGPGEGDWALARVESCPGRRKDVGWLAVSATTSFGLDNKVTTAGFPKDRAWPNIAVHHGCSIRARFDTGALIHDCATENGQSGSPLLLHENGRLTVVAMVSGIVEPKDRTAATSNTNYAAPIGDILRQGAASAALAADRSRAGRSPFEARLRR
jgi:V8-like Glu-specific endopeptidase